MTYTILDCYTDEPSGLGVPPYLGTYPRYLFGALKGETNYITIDDLRFNVFYRNQKPKRDIKTDIKVYNLTKPDISEILKKTKELIIILGVHTPGKYLSALPGTLYEVAKLTENLNPNCKKILTGPASTEAGTRLEGGKRAETIDLSQFDEVAPNLQNINSFEKIKEFSLKGAELVKQIPYTVIAELETAQGCPRKKGCSFCTEPLKSRFHLRNSDDIIKESKALAEAGVEHFRLGKQSDFFAREQSDMEHLLKSISQLSPKVLHIDNVNPQSVTEEKTKLVVKYCTAGNVAAFGVESFDEKVIEANSLNTTPEKTIEAVRVINRFGREIGENGIPKFLPGINIIFGLNRENRETHEKNMFWLKKILDENLLLRRINIRQVVQLPGTELYSTVRDKFVKKNKKYYWKWRHQIRQEIDFPMLKNLLPVGSVMKDVRTEIYDGNTTFGRQIGTYPLIVGIKGRLPLSTFYSVKVKSHMLRSVVGEVV